MKKTLIILLTALTLLCATNPQRLCAKPANPAPYTITQRDGTQLTLRTIGDEFFHYTTTTDGYTVVSNPQGDYFFAQLNEQGELVSTQILARPMARLKAAERTQIQRVSKGVKPLTTKNIRRQMAFRSPGNVTPPWSSVAGIKPPRLLEGTTAPSKGDLKTLVILVETADVPFSISNPLQSFTDILTKDGYNYNGATGSAWNYFQDNSNKQFNLQFVFTGPHRVSKTTAEYAGKGGMINFAELVKEACELANKDINFSDFSSDGQAVRDIFIFYAGYSQADHGGTYTIWPHRSSIANHNLYLDGVQIKGYACGSEYIGPKSTTVMDGIGTFCHEFGHVLGWPDFYDTQGKTPTAFGADIISLMDAGVNNNEGNTPPALSLLERWMVGWATPKELSAKGNYTLNPVTSNEGYLIRTSASNEYFLVEYRGAGVTAWDNRKYINNAQGMFVYHIDTSTPDPWAMNEVNIGSAPHECMMIVRANEQSTNMSGIVFPGTENAKELSSEKITHYKMWTGGAIPVILSDITVTDNKTVTFRIDKGPQPISNSISLSGYEYPATTPIELAINATEEPKSVVWYINNQLTTETELTLPVGEHTICAVITTADGDKEYITKYIAVK